MLHSFFQREYVSNLQALGTILTLLKLLNLPELLSFPPFIFLALSRFGLQRGWNKASHGSGIWSTQYWICLAWQAFAGPKIQNEFKKKIWKRSWHHKVWQAFQSIFGFRSTSRYVKRLTPPFALVLDALLQLAVRHQPRLGHSAIWDSKMQKLEPRNRFLQVFLARLSILQNVADGFDGFDGLADLNRGFPSSWLRRFWKNLPNCDRTASCHVRLLNDKFLSLVLHDLVEGVEATKMLGLTLREVSSHLGKGEDGDEGMKEIETTNQDKFN